VPKEGPAWQRWLTRHPVQYELPAGVTADLPALLEAGDAPWVERVAARMYNVMDGATADDISPVVAWEWACCSPPYLGERDPPFHHQDARTELRVRETSGILVSASQVESTQIHVSAGRDCSGSCPQSQRGITPPENPAQDADRYARVTTRTPGSLGAKRTKTTEATQTQR